MSLAAGTRLGPYEILAPLGAGGMGEVYRARDTRLKREVALKILPREFATDAVRRQRFESEARTVAALNHPNIIAIYDVGSEDGTPYIVSELIDGQPLLRQPTNTAPATDDPSFRNPRARPQSTSVSRRRRAVSCLCHGGW